MTTNDIMRATFTGVGAVMAALEPTLPYLGICTLAIFYDCWTAWQLSRRVRRKHPERTRKGEGKFSSHHFGRVILTLLKAYALIALAFLMNKHITGGWGADLTKVAAGAVCFWQLWSILENESSCNGARWARMAQKILLDKTERHFDLDLSGLEGDDEATEGTEATNN